MNKKKKGLILTLALLATTVLISALIIPNPGHSSDEIGFNMNGNITTLQEAINNNNLFILPATITQITQTGNGHNTENIWVSVASGEKTLSNALKTAKGLCGTAPKTYTQNIDPGHVATEIGVVVDGINLTLQEAINNGLFCAEWEIGSCSASCGGGSQTVICKRGDGLVLDDNYCTDAKPSTSCNTQSCCTPSTISLGTNGGTCATAWSNIGKTCTNAIHENWGTEGAHWGPWSPGCSYAVRGWPGDCGQWTSANSCGAGKARVTVGSATCYCGC